MKAKRGKEGKKRSAVAIALLAIGVIAVLSIVVGLSSMARMQGGISIAQISGSNLNLSQVDSIVSGRSLYTSVLSNNVTRVSGPLKAAGYLSISASEFYLESIPNFSYPTIITSTIYLFSNSSTAQLFSNGLVYTGGTVTAPGRIFVNRTNVRYLYNGDIINITVVPSVAVLNQSFLNQQTSSLPIYQYTAYFTYKNAVGVVSTSGYYKNSIAYSYLLAEDLSRNLINSAA